MRKPQTLLLYSLVAAVMLLGLGALLGFGLLLKQPEAAQGATTAGQFTLPRPDNAFHSITIHDGTARQVLYTRAPTVGDALQEAGITLGALDQVEPAPQTALQADLQIIVRRAIPLTVQVDGQQLSLHSAQPDAPAVLAEAGITLAGEDYTRPAAGVPLKPGDVIEVMRVSEQFLTTDEAIPYETIWQPSERLELDTEGLLQAGQPGILRRRVRVRLENGQEVSRTPDGEWVAQEPVPEIMGYGTRIVIRAVNTPNGAYNYWRMVRMRVTSYTASSSGKPPDHPAYGITASGYTAGTGIVAVDRAVVPFRSWVYVPGYGVGYAGDTGGGVIGRWIDLGYDEESFIPWSGYVDVYYLAPPPDPEDINYRLPQELP